MSLATPTTRASALILAGARASGDPLSLAHGVETKALIDIGGQPMLERVLRALRLSDRVEAPIYVSGLKGEVLAQASGAERPLPAVSVTGGPASSLLGAIEGGLPLPLLVTTCDHALLTADMVSHFAAEALASGADLCVGLASRETIQAAYPDTRRTYIPFGRAPMSGCNLFFVGTPQALNLIRFWKEAEQDRKRPWRIAWRFGPFTALRLLLGKPDANTAFRMISRRLGARVHPVIMPFAEAAIDVDSEADLSLVRAILAARSAA